MDSVEFHSLRFVNLDEEVEPRTIPRLQIFLPIFVLQLVNGFWYYLLWRILYRLVVGVKIADIREEGESDEEEDEVVEKKKDK